MSDAIKKLHDYLAKSPSVIYPEDVLEYLPAIEAENAKLREENRRLIIKLKAKHIVRQNVVSENAMLRELCERCAIELYVNGNVTDAMTEKLLDDMRELGIEVEP